MNTKPLLSVLLFFAVAVAPTPAQSVSPEDASGAGACIDQGRERVRGLGDPAGLVYPFAPVGYRFIE